MRQTLDSHFAAFLRKKRGETTYVAFAKKLRISRSHLYRLEQGQQTITLKKLQEVLDRLKCGISEVFPNGKS
jgi:transcriptional regulator with XRE-family HTH domain